VLPNKEDKTFPHDIHIDDEFYVRIAGRLGSYVTIFVAADSEISADAAAETKVGGSIYRRQINVRSGVLDKIETQETLVHEMTHAGLFTISRSCAMSRYRNRQKICIGRWEKSFVTSRGHHSLLTNGASDGPGDPVCTRAYEMAKKAQSEKDHVLPSKGHTGIGSHTQKRSRVQEESRCSQPVLGYLPEGSGEEQTPLRSEMPQTALFAL